MIAIPHVLPGLARVEAQLVVATLPGVTWDVTCYELREALSEPYECALEVTTRHLDVDVEAMVGADAQFTLQRGFVQKPVCGVLENVVFMGVRSNRVHLRLHLAPAFKALRFASDCRIFQQQSVPQIVFDLLSQTLSPFQRSVRLDLQATYQSREYCVQFRETTFDFVQRLLAQEGIVYFFDHSGEREVMVLVDGPHRYEPSALLGGECLPLADDAVEATGTESVSRFVWNAGSGATSFQSRTYDWTRPRALLQHQQRGRDVQGRELEFYHPNTTPGIADPEGVLAKRTKLEHERMVWRQSFAAGQSNALGLAPGRTFFLSGHHMPRLEQRYLLVSVAHSGTLNPNEARGDAVGAQEYVNSFECIPEATPFRPAQVARGVPAFGPQTATVVGPANEAIHCDAHGRVKVKFHWDRLGRDDETASCWVRVSQQWAGAGFGVSFLPRVGMEVVVAFEEGDLDRPLIVGCVHNGGTPTPSDLPRQKTVSQIKTRSVPSTGGFNALSFDDAAGAESVRLQAERDLSIVVKNNKSQQVQGEETLRTDGTRRCEVARNQWQCVGGDDETTVRGNRFLTVEQNDTTRVTGSKTTEVAGSQTFTVGGDREVSVSGHTLLSHGGDFNQWVRGGLQQQVEGAAQVRVVRDAFVGVGGEVTFDGADDVQAQVGQHLSITVGGDGALTIQGCSTSRVVGSCAVLADTILLQAENQLRIEVGSAQLEMCKDGTITLRGSKLQFESSGELMVKSATFKQN